ncbi:NADP-dependent oxidoreductase [Actinoplanes sp. NPDC049265]|uniref:NADP-dependent oxidoreductase n=1 Tax=Actinoplanes sp. NPDC049265 TaxID=3363902 RepID=UPI0037208DFB
MRAVTISDFGSPDEITFTERPEPQAGEGEVVVRVEAATVNPVDGALIAGHLSALLPKGSSAPYTPGWDLAGRVESVGHNVGPDLVGARVLGFSQWFHAANGTQAELVRLARSSVVQVKDQIEATELTTFGLNGLTAVWALERAPVQMGQVLLVTGGTGAIGGFTVQIAASRGVEVVTVGRSGDVDRLRRLGARHVIDRDADVAGEIRKIYPHGVDGLVAAGPADQRALAAVRDGGVATTMAGELERERSIELRPTWVEPDQAILEAVVDLVQDGVLTARLGEVFPANRAADAYRALLTRDDHRRIVLAF